MSDAQPLPGHQTIALEGQKGGATDDKSDERWPLALLALYGDGGRWFCLFRGP